MAIAELVLGAQYATKQLREMVGNDVLEGTEKIRFFVDNGNHLILVYYLFNSLGLVLCLLLSNLTKAEICLRANGFPPLQFHIKCSGDGLIHECDTPLESGSID